MLKHTADLRSMAYVLLMTFLLFFLFTSSEILGTNLEIFAWILQLLMGISVGVIIHNHKHVPMWKSKVMNVITDCWLTLFYGFPVYGWIPTHVQNHHKHNNKEPDYTKTYGFSERNTLLTLLRYPAYSSSTQLKAIIKYTKEVYANNKSKFWVMMLQVVCLVAFMIIMIAIDWKRTVLFVVLPQQIALNGILAFNYFQHIHTDEKSEFNHSRNFEGPLNWFLFNNGLHTIHHIDAGIHWSKLPEHHQKIRAKIDPSLNEQSAIWFFIRQYILGPIYPKWKTKNMREIRLASESKAA